MWPYAEGQRTHGSFVWIFRYTKGTVGDPDAASGAPSMPDAARAIAPSARCAAPGLPAHADVERLEGTRCGLEIEAHAQENMAGGQRDKWDRATRREV